MNNARQMVCEHFNETQTDYVKDRLVVFDPDDFYIVWFSKTLQNWKALVATDRFNGIYYEVIHNGDRLETYLEVYIKASSAVVPDGLFKHINKEMRDIHAD